MSERRLLYALAKTAANNGLAEGVGRAIAATVSGGAKVIDAGGNVGSGLAKGLGGAERGQAYGRAVGTAGVLGTAYLGGKAVKDRFDEWRYRHNFHPSQAVYGG